MWQLFQRELNQSLELFLLLLGKESAAILISNVHFCHVSHFIEPTNCLTDRVPEVSDFHRSIDTPSVES